MVRTSGEKPTEFGPGTDGPVWSEGSHRWVFPLNAHGRRVCEAFLDKYHHAPQCSIVSFDGGRYRVPGRLVLADAMKLLGEAETVSVANDAAVRACARYEPQAHGCSDDGYTFVVTGVYLALKRAVEVFRDRSARRRELQGPDLDGLEVFDAVEGYDPSPEDAAVMGEWRETLDDVGRFLGQRERQVVVARFRYGWTLQEVAEAVGVTRERVRQIEGEAVKKLRRAFARRNTNTPGDGYEPLPPRSLRCLRKTPSAAVR